MVKMVKYCIDCRKTFDDVKYTLCPYCGKELIEKEKNRPPLGKLRHQILTRDGYRCRDYHYKGLGIFAKENVKLEKIEGLDEDFKNFIPLRVNDSFNLLGVWAMPKYIEMIHDYFDANHEKLFDENLIMCGDFNSNAVFNPKHRAKDKNGNAKDHTNLDVKLNSKGLYSLYHKLSSEENGKESKFTFFQPNI